MRLAGGECTAGTVYRYRAEDHGGPEMRAGAGAVIALCLALAAIVGVQGPAARFDSKVMGAAVADLQSISVAMSHALGFEPELTKERE